MPSTASTQPVVAHALNQKAGVHLGRSTSSHGVVEFFIRCGTCNVHHIDKLYRCSSPNECNHTFRHHCPIEAAEAVLLVLDASCHHGALRGMEAADCATGYRDEQAGEERRVLHGVMVSEGFGKAENLLPLEPRYTAGHIKDFAEFI